jgi:hypothetical protein
MCIYETGVASNTKAGLGWVTVGMTAEADGTGVTPWQADKDTASKISTEKISERLRVFIDDLV